jgi:ABC-type uncharacterized transport system permease subunit
VSRFLTKVWCVLRLVWSERLVYRVNFLLEILSGLCSSVILVFLWIAIYRSSDRHAIGEYQLGEMVTYILDPRGISVGSRVEIKSSQVE